jgi:uncharacterized protein YndB with AHSA1/START domain
LYIGSGLLVISHMDGDTTMPSFHHTIEIAATPEQVWQVLGDMTSVDRWIPR